MICAYQVLAPSLVDSQKCILKEWLDEYESPAMRIALSDTLGTEKFLKDFDDSLANEYFGIRHDSGEPFNWGEDMIVLYQKLGIDPKTKLLVFSDCIDFDKAFKLVRVFSRRIGVAFGIGTHLGNDCGFKVYQMVFKMVQCNGKPVVKLSNSVGKGMCEDKEFETNLKKVIEDDLKG